MSVIGCGQTEIDVELNNAISGMVEIDNGLATRLTGDERVFVIARSLEEEPVAVQPVSGLGFPLNFCISSANVLYATAQLAARVLLSALVTTSNDPFGNGLMGELSHPVSLGSQDIRIWITSEFTVVDSASPATSAKTTSRHGSIRSRSVRGTVTLAVLLNVDAKSSDVLYIIARGLDGRLLAVSAPYREPQFPLKYHLGGDNTMMGRISDDQDMVVIARLDRDGDAFSSPGDLEGESKQKPIRIGDVNVDIVLDTLVR